MKKVISNRATFLIKMLGGIIFILILIAPLHQFIKDPTLFRFFSEVIFVPIILYIIYKHFFSLKKVSLDKNNLYISNYLKEIVVPLEHIQRFETSSRSMRTPLLLVFLFRKSSPPSMTVTLHIKDNSGNNKLICFIPIKKYWDEKKLFKVLRPSFEEPKPKRTRVLKARTNDWSNYQA